MADFTGLTLAQLISSVRSYVSEPSEGFLTKPEITTWLNAAQMDFQRQTKVLRTSATTTSVASQQTYSVPADYQRMEAVFWSTTRLDVTNLDEVIALSNGNITSTGTPRVYFLRGTAAKETCLHLWPVPTVTGTTISLYYEQKPDVLVNDSDVPIFSSEWDDAFVMYAASRARLKMRQLAEARELMDQYKDYVYEAHVRRQRQHSDIPIAQNRFELYKQDIDLDLLNGRI